MTTSQKLREVSELEYTLAINGLEDIVEVTVEVMENERGRKTPHVVARYTETKQKCDMATKSWIYVDEVTERIEELNNYFDAQIFAMGITQRAEWLKADTADRVKYLKSNHWAHPARYIAA